MTQVTIKLTDNDETQSVDLEAEFYPQFEEDSAAHQSAVIMVEALKQHIGSDGINSESRTFAGEDEGV